MKNNFVRKVSITFAFMALLWLNAFQHVAAQGSWSIMPPMPTARWVLAAAAGEDGIIYAVGGLSSSGSSLNTLEAYDPQSMTWTRLAPMPTARHGLAATVDDCGYLYAFGGTSGDILLNRAELYDPSADAWIALPPMPTARTGAAAVTGPDGKIYVIGGSQGGPDHVLVLNTVEAYDPDTNAWTRVASLSAPRGFLTAARAYNGYIYAIAGRDPRRDYFLTEVHAYDPSSDTWTAAAPIPTGRYNLASAVGSDGRIYVLGGFAGVSYSNVVEVYDPDNNRWTRVAGMRTGREGPGAALGSDGRVYAIGGLTCEPDCKGGFPVVRNSVEAYTP